MASVNSTRVSPLPWHESVSTYLRTSYEHVRSGKVAGRSFPCSSHLRGRKVNFALQPTWPRSVLGGKVGEKRLDDRYYNSTNATSRFHSARDAVSSNAETLVRRGWPCVLEVRKVRRSGLVNWLSTHCVHFEEWSSLLSLSCKYLFKMHLYLHERIPSFSFETFGKWDTNALVGRNFLMENLRGNGKKLLRLYPYRKIVESERFSLVQKQSYWTIRTACATNQARIIKVLSVSRTRGLRYPPFVSEWSLPPSGFISN